MYSFSGIRKRNKKKETKTFLLLMLFLLFKWNQSWMKNCIYRDHGHIWVILIEKTNKLLLSIRNLHGVNSIQWVINEYNEFNLQFFWCPLSLFFQDPNRRWLLMN